MEKILFTCDLDNTLIHSYKHRRPDDICVELYDGRAQSFISPRALELLKEIAARIFFVPVTTRSIAQYRRIFWAEDFQPQCAVVANGAFFLEGARQENFLRETVAPYEKELEAQLAAADEKFFSITRVVDESFLFLKCREEFDAEKIFFDTSLVVRRTGKKIYLFPPALNKGAALKLLAKKFSPDKIFAAGDSEIDLPMLALADVAFAPKNLRGKNFVEFAAAEDFLEKILSEAHGR
ncbi:MAG: HAD hydrolase family protein [Selenomonadaceae bacterium]|nr:HAD hydrolase family protein [Selenomonadaceae bacterium]MBQ3727079.1 HAD hydrolase family protein [Selenomonadaceae bacterium]